MFVPTEQAEKWIQCVKKAQRERETEGGRQIILPSSRHWMRFVSIHKECRVLCQGNMQKVVVVDHMASEDQIPNTDPAALAAAYVTA